MTPSAARPSPARVRPRAFVCGVACALSLVTRLVVAQTLAPPAATAPVVPAASVPGAGTSVDHEIRIAADAFVKDATTPGWVVPHAPVASTAKGPAVVTLSDHQIRIGDPVAGYVHTAVRVADAAALTPLGRVPIPFIPAYQKIVLHTLQVDRDGAVLDRLPTAEVRFLQRETGLERNLYDGVVTASILIDDLRVGDTIEVAYSVIGTNPVFGRRFSGMENWDQALPIAYRRLIVNAPEGRTVRWKFHGDLSKTFPRPVEERRDGMRSLSFEERDLPRVPPETLVPAGFNAFRWVQVSEYDDWSDVASWASSLFDVGEPVDASDAERAKVVASSMAQPTTEARIVAALEFVQSQIRYFSVSLGTSSHRPAAPNVVLARRYGDCKDKSLLLIALLHDMGIASTPVLARLGNRSGFDDWLPTPQAFDHVIVAVDVDGRRYWLDPTRQGQHGRLATMGQAHDGAQVLPATRDGRLERVDVADRDALDLNEVHETLTVPSFDGDGTLTVVQTLHGVAAENMRVSSGLLTKERIDQGLVDDMQKRYPRAKLVGSLAIDDDREHNRVTLTSGFTLDKPLEHADGQYRVGFRPANFARLFNLPSEGKRRAPIAMRYPAHVVYRFDATFPEQVAVVDERATVAVDSRFFEASTTRSFVANRSQVTLTLRTLVDRVAAADLPALRDDLRKLDRASPGRVVVRDGDIKQSTLLGLATRDFATTLKTRQQDTVARLSKSLATGRLAGSDLARAYCLRAHAQAALGETDASLADADRAVGVDSDATGILICRAQVRIRAVRLPDAVEDASHAIALDAGDAAAWRVRGEARFYLGRYAEAVDDFVQAAGVEHDDRQRVYDDLWRAMALRRLGRPLPDDLLQRAADGATGAWPKPALALFADRIALADLIARAADPPGDEATMKGTEADFYVGEFHLARGERAPAHDAFAAARARGVVVYTEYVGAMIELERLDAAAR